MRAATVIVAAVAVVSILVALAFILSPDGSSTGGTTTIEKVVEAQEEPSKTEGVAQKEASDDGGGEYGGPKQCGGSAYTVEGTSCAIGAQIHEAYEGGHRGDFFIKDVETGTVLSFFCKDETEPITCTGEEGGVVYFGS
jgi:hypothetical protein